MAKAKKKLSKISKASKTKAPAKAKSAKPAAKKKLAAKPAPAKTKKAAPTPKAKIPAAKTKVTPTQKSTLNFATAFTPLDDRVLVRRSTTELRTPGGLYIPDSVASADRPTQGKVVAVGRGHQDKKGRIRPLDVQNGDTVMFTAFAGSEITIDNQELLVLREQDILAIVKS